MEPDSIVLVVVLFVLSAAAIFAVARWRAIWSRAIAGVLAMLLCTAGGIAVVNDFYGYYTTWGQLTSDLSGSYQAFTTAPTNSREFGKVIPGKVEKVMFAGKTSHYDRPGIVYLPPQYFEKAYKNYRFPVVELLHGTPGTPSNWIVNLNTSGIMNSLLNQHQAGPMVLVIPTMSVGHDYQECVNAPGALDDTYITDEVRQDVFAKYRVSHDPAQWGIAGYSSGGYCAANLALRHPSDFGASAIMDGYFRPTDGPAVDALHHNQAAMNANNPLIEAAKLTTGSHPLPSFWVAAGTGVSEDIKGAQAFTQALHGVEQVTLYAEHGATHNFTAWRPDIPRFLAWMWTQLATPQQRVNFPISGPVAGSSIAVSPSKPS